MEINPIIAVLIFIFFIGIIIYLHRQVGNKDIYIKELRKLLDDYKELNNNNPNTITVDIKSIDGEPVTGLKPEDFTIAGVEAIFEFGDNFSAHYYDGICEVKQYTSNWLKDKLTEKFDDNGINYDHDQLNNFGADYIDDSFTNVFGSIIEVIKDLGIKVSE